MIPEKIASAVTDEGTSQVPLLSARAVEFTFPVNTAIYGLWKFNIFKGYLLMLVVVGLDANQSREQGEGRENLKLHGNICSSQELKIRAFL